MSTITTILGTDVAGNSRAVINTNFANLNADKKEVGYVLTAYSATFSPSDSTTYYWGSFYNATPATTGGTSRIYIPKAGIIKKVYALVSVASTLGSAETSTMSIRLNDTTDTTISSAILTTAAQQVYSATTAITVAEGDYIQIKWVTPAWTTNPSTIRIPVQIYIE